MHALTAREVNRTRESTLRLALICSRRIYDWLAPKDSPVMMLRLTEKALALLGNERATLTASPADDEDWYLNLVWVDGRKCFLIMHAGTLFSVFTADVRTAELRPIGRFVVATIQDALRSEALPDRCFGPLDADQIQIGKTASRQMLGFMNELVLEAKLEIAEAGGLGGCDIAGLNRGLRRRMHNSRGEYVSAMELVAERLVRLP